MTDKTITLTVSEKMFEAIAADAARTGLSMSSTVERQLSLSMFEGMSTRDRLMEACRAGGFTQDLRAGATQTLYREATAIPAGQCEPQDFCQRVNG